MVDAFNIVQDRIARSRLAGDPPDAILSPRLQDVGLFDFHRAESAIERGAESVQRHLRDIERELEDLRAIGNGRAQQTSRGAGKEVTGRDLQPVAK
jgi:NTE family protein